MDYVAELKRINDRTAKKDDSTDDAVIVGTMHSWKGLEVPTMFVPIVRGKFPRSQFVKTPDGKVECIPPDPNSPELASERRLAYVAITRAEENCILMDIPHPSIGCAQSQFFSEACIPIGGDETTAVDEEDLPRKTAADDFYDAMAAQHAHYELSDAWGEID